MENRGPLYCAGLGKAILAFLPEEKRYALYDMMDFLPLTKNTITDAKVLERWVPLVCDAAALISREVGGSNTHSM